MRSSGDGHRIIVGSLAPKTGKVPTIFCAGPEKRKRASGCLPLARFRAHASQHRLHSWGKKYSGILTRRVNQQPSYGAQLDWPPAAMALLNTWFCSATLALPKLAGLPP